jgi:hypothetical protein
MRNPDIEIRNLGKFSNLHRRDAEFTKFGIFSKEKALFRRVLGASAVNNSSIFSPQGLA